MFSSLLFFKKKKKYSLMSEIIGPLWEENLNWNLLQQNLKALWSEYFDYHIALNIAIVWENNVLDTGMLVPQSFLGCKWLHVSYA